MAGNYGYWTADEIRSIVVGTAKEAWRISAPDALMAFKWNDHSWKLPDVLTMMSAWWEPLFGHGARGQQRHGSMTFWVMLRRRPSSDGVFTLTPPVAAYTPRGLTRQERRDLRKPKAG